MEFNCDKCKVKHFNKLNQSRTYPVNGRAMGNAAEQRDFGVQVYRFLKVVTQVDRVLKVANGMLSFTCQGTEYNSWDLMVQLF